MKLHIFAAALTPIDPPIMRIRSSDVEAKQFLHDIRETLIEDEPICVLEAYCIAELAKWHLSHVAGYEDLIRNTRTGIMPKLSELSIRPEDGAYMKFSLVADSVPGRETLHTIMVHPVDDTANKLMRDLNLSLPWAFGSNAINKEIAIKYCEARLLLHIAEWHAVNVKAWEESKAHNVLSAEPRIGHVIFDSAQK